MMLERVNAVRQLWRHFGPGWLLFRGRYAAKLRSGWMARRHPVQPWEALPFDSLVTDGTPADPGAYLAYRRREAPPFFFDAEDARFDPSFFAGWDQVGNGPVAEADHLAEGKLRFFQGPYVETGFPPAWHRNHLTGRDLPANLHWSRIGDFGSGDIKAVWEPNRFGFVFALVRTARRTGDERYGRLFWELVADWRRHNPPQQGPNWKCGQETSLRLMAWCFGLYAFLYHPAATPENVQRLVQMIVQSGRRIESNLPYGVNQRNNHGISEGMGLWTIGTLFPELRQAERWREMGRRVLEELGRQLIDDDGAFSQHSVNYHRLMLHDYLWCLRLGDINGRPFSDQLRERVRRAGQWLYQLQIGGDGRAPNYGQNDGALILPLSNCAYGDYRPVIQSIHYLTTGTRCYPPGPWDEDLLWLFGPDALEAPLSPPEKKELAAGVSGYYTFHDHESVLFTRCGAHHHRPAQADMLHVDLWWRGEPIAIDAGTYSYNAPPPWDNPLAGTGVHNTVTVDGRDQMTRAGKFLWLPWVQGAVQMRRESEGGELAYWQGTHEGYRRLNRPVHYRRGIFHLFPATWLICDDLSSTGIHTYRLQWLLAYRHHRWDEEQDSLSLWMPDGEMYSVQVGGSDAGYTVQEGAPDSARGWYAPTYQTRRPALSLAGAVSASRARFWTLFAPHPYEVVSDEAAQLRLNGPNQSVTIVWQENQPSLVKEVLFEGSETRILEIAA